ncbi:response regulator transcription factor [Rhodobacterales bacterium]|nr:response regulator transcription factor [Rhodobacterales bacterium]
MSLRLVLGRVTQTERTTVCCKTPYIPQGFKYNYIKIRIDSNIHCYILQPFRIVFHMAHEISMTHAHSDLAIVSPTYFVREGVRTQLSDLRNNIISFPTMDELERHLASAPSARSGDTLLAIVDLGALDESAFSQLRGMWTDQGVRCIVLSDEENFADLRGQYFEGLRAIVSHGVELQNFAALIGLIEAGYVILPEMVAKSAQVASMAGFGQSQLDEDGADELDLETIRTGLYQLTARETQVLKLVGKGFGNKRVATQLNISATTVRLHLRSILRKLGIENRTQAALIAINNLATLKMDTAMPIGS